MSNPTQPVNTIVAETGATTGGARLSGIDALRAVAMLLGILFHSLIAYRVNPLPTWPYDDQFHHWSFDFVYLFIHSFRMPLFFLIGGYFCRLLLYKTGERAFINHRIKRILVPFVVSLVLILPFTLFPFLVFKYSQGNQGDWNNSLQLAWRQLFHWNGMAHLWFLYYLIIYYVLAIGGARLNRTVFAGSFIKRIAGFMRHHTVMTVIAILAVWLLLLWSPELYLHVATGILPAPVFLVFYAVFFGIGWLLQKMPEPFSVFVKYMNGFLLTGICLAILLFVLEYGGYLHQTEILGWVKGIAAIQIVFMVYGVIGFFLKYFASAGEKWRYISDASYWMYLVHLGLIAGLQVLFIYLGVIPVLRFPLVLIITVLASLFSYQFFVRHSILGEYLHGKRSRKSSKIVPEVGTGRLKRG
ncbi:MAG: acyltransferase family protein [Chitinophagaceae bacterium]